MDNRIRVLFYNTDGAGVNYFRTLTPAIELDKNHSNEFYTEINPQLNFDDPNIINYLKSFDIIHYHRQLVPDLNKMKSIADELKKNGTILVCDIDDYWHLHPKHPLYGLNIEKKLYVIVLENLKIADYITTTTELFADEIHKVTGKNNVIVLENSIDPTWMKQFQNNWKPDPDGLVRITYMAGSSHYVDLEQLEGVVNVLWNNPELKGKFKIIVAGWDTQGVTTEITLNQDFLSDLQKRGLWTQEMINEINRSKGDVNKIKNLPNDLKNKYNNNIFLIKERNIKSEESVYYFYEKILTDNHRIIENEDYKRWLLNFERNVKYPNEGNYARRWTQKANIYAQVLDETDIVIAPLADNQFNRMKSNLKQVECWSRKLPIVCSDIPPYNVDGRHMENCVLIPAEKNAHKYWQKYLKRLILDADLRKKLGEQLYEDFKEKYHLANVTKKRADFYSNIVLKRKLNNNNNN